MGWRDAANGLTGDLGDASPDTSGEAVLDHPRTLRLVDDRRLRQLGTLSLLAGLLPVGLGGAEIRWLWDVLPVAEPLEAVAWTSPLVAGVALWLLPAWRGLTRLGLGLCGLLLAALGVGAYDVGPHGPTELFGGFLGFVGRQPLAVFGGLALTALGASLRQPAVDLEPDPDTPSDARAHRADQLGSLLLAAGGAALLLLYVLPQRGVPFAAMLVAPIQTLAETEQLGVLFSSIPLWITGLTPALLGGWALAASFGKGQPGMLASAARYALPGLAALLCYRMLAGGFGLPGVLVQLRAALSLALVVGLVSRALEMVLRHLLVDDAPPPGEPATLDGAGLARDWALEPWLRAHALRDDPSPRPLLGLTPRPEAAATPGPALRALMHQRVQELAVAEHRVVGAGPDLPVDAATAAALHARLTTGSSDAPADGVTPPQGRPGPTTRASLWLGTGPARLPAAVALALGVLAGLGAWAGAPPQPNLAWELSAPGDSDTTFFRTTLPEWVLSLGARNVTLAEGEVSAAAAVEAREATASTLADARDIHPRLADALDGLQGVLGVLDLEGRLWMKAIARVNAEIRAVELPFWVDAGLLEREGDDGQPVKLPYVTTYLVERVDRMAADGRTFGAIHARRLDELDLDGAHLGFVLPDEPFALVVLDEIEGHVRDQVETLRATASCGVTQPFMARDVGESRAYDDVDRRCGAKLRELLAARGQDLETVGGWDGALRSVTEMVVASTQRHEVQHQIDGEALDVPGELHRLVPLAHDAQLERPAKETSAYLAELDTDDPVAIVWTLAHLTGFVATGEVYQSPYRYAGGLVLGAMAGESLLRPLGGLKWDVLRKLWERVTAAPPDALVSWARRTARQAHEDLLGTPLGEVVALD